MNAPFRLIIKVRANIEEIPAIRGWAEKLGINSGLDDFAVEDVKLALVEIFTNIIKHSPGHGLDGQGNIRIVAAFDGEKSNKAGLRLLIQYRDGNFSPKNIKRPDFIAPGTGGYGVYLLGQIMHKYRTFTFSKDMVWVYIARNKGKRQ